ncbi:MAG: ATP-binding protein [Tolypothrix carrinoi HA7290-LM1]|jgi:hypothetical protein|nr:ATP-binding protein [Tolypothrix carrinoi HA7290-LM1]
MSDKKKPTLEKSDVSKHHFQPVFEIQDNSYQRSFVIGTHIDTNKIISLDFARLLESSVGVFGNPGTGKTFLTRLLLSGLISQQAAVNLIFDLHSEYGWEVVSRGQPSIVKGLWHLFPKSVEIYTLDSESTRRQGIHAHELYLSYDQIDVEDIKLVSQDLGLSEDSIDNANILHSEFGKRWIVQLLNMTNEEIQIFCNEKRGQKDLIMALQHKLQRLDGLKNMRASLPQNYIHQLLQSLADGKNVVVMFGSEFDMLSYKLITNMIARRIYLHYVRKTEKFLQTKNPKDRPCQLVITIEDAHHLLNSNTVRHNIFNNIIRQSWKSCITLLAVERYPSRIDKEVMSELGTRITGLLNDEDIDAISTGIPSYHCLRSMLSKLDSTQQAVIFGHVVTAPVAVRTRPYDEQFYDEIRDVAR